VEEWDFSAPDAKGVWTVAERRFLSIHATGLVPAGVQTGTVIRYQRRADDKVESRFLKGGATSDAAARGLAVFPFTPEYPGLGKCWPPDSVEVGGTWPINGGDVPGFGQLPNTKGSATGKLISTDSAKHPELVVIEIAYDLLWQVEGAKNSYAGTMRFQINPREGYIPRYESEGNGLTIKTVMTKR
jgi:hypothetical protein